MASRPAGVLVSDWLRSHNVGMGGDCDWLRPGRHERAPNDDESPTQTDGGMWTLSTRARAGAGVVVINHSSLQTFLHNQGLPSE